MVKKQIPAVVLIVLFVGTYGAFAEPQTGVPTQDPQQLKQQFAEAQQQNKEALLSYSWQSRTEIKLKGESKNVKLEQVRYGLDGALQKTPIAGTEEPQQQESTGGRRRRGGRAKERIVKRKTEEFTAEMQALGALVASYAQLSAEETQAFAAAATVGEGEGDLAGTVRINGGGIKQPGDEMTVWIDRQTFMMRRVEIHTSYEDNEVSLTAEFLRVVDGPTYPARTTLQYPQRELELPPMNARPSRLAQMAIKRHGSDQ